MAELPAPAMDGRADEAPREYLVGPMDVLAVSVFQVPDLTREVQIDPLGTISLPLVGTLNVRGKTTAQVDQDLTQRLAKYIRTPDVTVSVKEAMSQRVTVEGAVNQPGVYSVTQRTSLLQMIATARGLDKAADQRMIVIFRTVNGEKMAAAFDIKSIRDGRLADPDVYGNDIIVVERSGSKSALRDALSVVPLVALFRPFLF